MQSAKGKMQITENTAILYFTFYTLHFDFAF